MSNRRIERVNELLKREVAGILYRLLSEDALDLSTLTVTRVETSSDLRHARIMVSIRAGEREQHNMLASLYRRRALIQKQINRDTTLKYTPRLSFHLDRSLEAGDHVLAILRELETEAAENTDETPHPPAPSAT